MGSRVYLRQKKINRPLISPRVMIREAYHNWAAQLVQSRLVTISAPAGYGKTTFLACAGGILSEKGAGNCRIAWYLLDEGDKDPAVFMTHLLESLGKAVPGLGEEAKRTLYSVSDVARDYRIILDQLCEDLWQSEAGVDGQILLIIDDYHLIKAQGIAEAVIHRLLQDSPIHFHFCLAGRQLPQGMNRFTLHNPVQEIDFQQLQLGPGEIELMLRETFQLQVTPQQAGEISRQTEGWAAGVVITAQTLQGYTQEEYTQVLSSAQKHREKIFAFFAQEVLQQQSPVLKEFLLRCSVLNVLSPGACEEVTGEAGAGEVLDSLFKTGLFLAASREGGEETSYRFHALFGGYLRQVLSQTRGKAFEVSLHRRAAEYYAESGNLDSALEHFWAAGDSAEAVALIKDNAQELLDSGYVEQVRSWLEQVPRQTREGDPYFLYLRGFIHQHSDQALALDCLQQASDAFVQQGQSHLLVRSIIYMCTIYSLQNRVDKLEQASARIPVVSALARDSWARGVLAVSALCQAAWNDRLSRAHWLIKLCQRFSLEPDWQWAMLAYSCMAYYRLGDLSLARRSIEEALAMPEVSNNDVFRGMALVLYHVVLYSQDDNEQAEKVREDLWEIGEKYNSHYYRAFAERARAFPYLHQGEWEQAEEMLRSSLYFFTRAGNQAMALITRLDLARLESCRGRAVQELEPARQAWRELCTLHCGQGLVEQGQTLLGIVAREAGKLELAEEMLLSSAKTSRRKGAKQSLAGTLLHLARLYHLKQDWARGDNYLQQGLSLAEANKYKVFWDWHRPTMAALVWRALDKGICQDYAKGLLDYWFGPQMEEAIGTKPQVSISCLGSFELTVGGRALPQMAWKTRKVQGLFKYLALAGGMRVSREQLTDIFWPEAGSEAGSASLRVSLSRLRKALDWYKEEGLAATHILGEGKGSLWLEIEAVSADIFIYQGIVQEARMQLQQGNTGIAQGLLEQARDLYRGELFADDPYVEWVALERERFNMLQLDLLLDLGSLYLGGGDWQRARECFTEGLAINPYREDIYCQLIKVYLVAGEKAEALRIYQRCKAMLQQEFGLEPGVEIRDLIAASIN